MPSSRDSPERQQFDIKSFDVAADGRRILFDRFRQNSDVPLIDLAR